MFLVYCQEPGHAKTKRLALSLVTEVRLSSVGDAPPHALDLVTSTVLYSISPETWVETTRWAALFRQILRDEYKPEPLGIKPCQVGIT